MAVFRWRHFAGEIILWAVRWYCRYGISYRDLAPGSRTGRFFSYAALAIVMSILACAGVRYPTLEWRRCRL
jgi:hypothetical protein